MVRPMSDNAHSPLLGADKNHNQPQRPASQRSRHSDDDVESTPLLARSDEQPSYDERRSATPSTAASSLRSLQSSVKKSKKDIRRWSTISAITLLCLIVLTILGLGFAAPAVVEEYARESITFKPTSLSIDSFTSKGVKARIQGDFHLDASKVKKKPVRDLGRAGTWIARKIEARQSKVQVVLPEYGDLLLGTADIPPIIVDIRDKHVTHIDIIADLNAGDTEAIIRMGKDWVDGRLERLRVLGQASVPLKSGIFSFGTQSITQFLEFKSNDIPVIPAYTISNTSFHEVELPHKLRGLAAEAIVAAHNDFPVDFTIPPLAFDILVKGCAPEETLIVLANATTRSIHVKPHTEVKAHTKGIVQQLPDTLINACPESEKSPLDSLLASYMNGEDTTVFVKGATKPASDTPEWIVEFMKDIVVPVPFPGHTFHDLIKNYSLADVHFDLPNPLASPGSPNSTPRLSATVKALVSLPEEIDFPLGVSRVRADASVYYKKKKLGDLDLHTWQKAQSQKVAAKGNLPAGLEVQSIVDKAPLNITDDDVFADVVQALVFGGKRLELGVKAKVDVETKTALGQFVIRDLPAEGKVFVNPLSKGNSTNTFKPKVGDLEILDTTHSTITLGAKVNITNPTDYSANVPFFNISMLVNDTLLGFATAENVAVVPGTNVNISVTALWDPRGPLGPQIGFDFLSQYISGYNTSLTFRTHQGTIPSQPSLGAALSNFSIQLPTPHLKPPPNPNHPNPLPTDPDPSDPSDPDGDDGAGSEAPHFIDDATFHLITSTCTLTLLSPLRRPLYIYNLNATALYNHTHPVGEVLYDLPFEVPPGASTTPRLPVDWGLGGVGYDAVKKALGGGLKLDARANVKVGIGKWRGELWYEGRGLGATIRL